MNAVKKTLIISALSGLPLLVIILQNFVIYRKGWESIPETISGIVYWSARLLLTPFVVWYTLATWTELRQVAKALYRHLAGFLIYTVLQWLLSFAVLYYLIRLPEMDRPTDLLDTIRGDATIVNLLIYWATVTYFYLWDYVAQVMRAYRREAMLEKELALGRLDNLKNQLNKHFLFNTMHTISSLIMHEKKEVANKTLVDLSVLLRFGLKENTQQLIPLRQEIDLATLYFGIQASRFKEKFSYRFSCAAEDRDALVPSLLLQPLLENAIKYAVEPAMGPVKIDILIERVGRMLCISVKDDGKYYTPSVTFDIGIGLANVQERLRMLYGEHHSFRMGSNAPRRGVEVKIGIPYFTKDNETFHDNGG